MCKISFIVETLNTHIYGHGYEGSGRPLVLYSWPQEICWHSQTDYEGLSGTLGRSKIRGGLAFITYRQQNVTDPRY